MSTRRRTALAVVLIFAAFALAPAARSQEPDAEPTSPETVPESGSPAGAAEPSVSEIARRIDRAAVLLREIAAAATPDPRIARIAADLENAEAEIVALDRDLVTVDVGRLSRRDVRDLRQEWVREQDRIDGWVADLSQRSDGLEAREQSLRSLAESWADAVRDPGRDLPGPLRARGATVLADLGRAADKIRARQDAVVGLLARAGDARVAVEEALARIDASRRDVGRKLLERNEPPIWALGADLGERPSAFGQIRSAIAHSAATLERFVSERTGALLAFLVLFLVLIAVLALLRRGRDRAGPEGGGDVDAARILGRPVAAAALIALVAMLWSNPDAPGAFFDVVLLGLLAPLLRLLPRIVYRDFRAPLFGLAALWIVERLGQLLTESSVVDRLLQLFVSTAALAGLALTLRSGGRLRARLTGRWGALARLVARLWLAGLAIAIAANVLGAVALAEVLAAASLNGLYLALVLFAAALTLDGLAHLALASAPARSLRFVRDRTARVEEAVGRFFRIAAAALWGYAVLAMLRVWDPLRSWSAGVLAHEMAFGSFRVTVGNLVAFAVAVAVSVLVSRFVRFVLEEDILARVDLPRGVPQTVSMLVHYGVLTLGLLIGLAAAGIEVTQFAIVLGALGVGIGFGLQTVVNNFISGLILIFERPIKLGDIVEIGTVTGEVKNIGIRASTIRTYEGAEVVVPNGNLLSSEMTNWTLSDRQRRIEIPVGVAYGSDPARVQALLHEVVDGRSDVLRTPAPQVLFQGFGDSSLDFTVRFWTADFDRWFVLRSETAIAIHAALREAGVEIPFPQRDVHVRTLPPGSDAPGRRRAPGDVHDGRSD